MSNAVKFLLLRTIEKLMIEKSIEEITIGDILKSSGVSRSTFYRYFSDKYALYNWVFGSYVDELISDGIHLSFRSFLHELILHILEKSKYYENAILYTGQNSFYEYFTERISEYFSLQLFAMHCQDLPIEKRYFIRYHCGAILRVLYEWIRLDYKESPQEICDIIVSAIRGENTYYSDPFFQ